ncbi:uncharacterized protein PG986_007912 [Apiospora aurea]|uniref:Uncharacterized protein n=1 Tax=Apiospora aurea TaxID=335848 RepID=A0ABR1QE61_9PEZI
MNWQKRNTSRQAVTLTHMRGGGRADESVYQITFVPVVQLCFEDDRYFDRFWGTGPAGWLGIPMRRAEPPADQGPDDACGEASSSRME